MEKYQQGCLELADEIRARVLEAGDLSADGSYRLSSGSSPSYDELMKRVINNLTMFTRRSSRYRIGLLDVSEDAVTTQRDILAKQVELLIASHCTEGTDVKDVAANVADVVTTSWRLLLKS